MASVILIAQFHGPTIKDKLFEKIMKQRGQLLSKNHLNPIA
jgi:hypothetical protein